MILKPMTDRRWRGYTLDELQEQLVMTDVRIMMQKKKLKEKVSRIKPSFATSGTDGDSDSGPLNKIMNIIGYVSMGIGIIRKILPFIRKFRKKQSN